MTSLFPRLLREEIFLSLLALACAASAAAQQATETQQPGSSGVTLKVTTQLTIEDVLVTDAQGKPVRGLTQSDFTVKEDGKPQPIKNFQEYDTEKPARQPPPHPLPPNIYTNTQPQAPITGAANILLLDDLNTGKVLRATVRLQALKYLKNLPPGTEIAILELAENQVHIVQGFTTDRDILTGAMNAILPTDPNMPHPVCSGELLNIRSRITTSAMDTIAGFASGVKGRKNLVWFTTGLWWITHYAELAPRSDCLTDFRPELQRSYGRLTAAQVAIYPVDPRGCCFADIEAMEEMASATGGKAYYNRNDLDAAMGEAIATGLDYYSLSYVPPLSNYDGKYHTIKVTVDRPGLNLKYRDGYTSVDFAAKPAEKGPAKKSAPEPPPPVSAFHAAMEHGALPSTQVQFGVQVTPSTRPRRPGAPPVGVLSPALKGKPVVLYDFVFVVPSSQLTLVDGTTGSVELNLAAYGQDGAKLNVFRDTVKFKVPVGKAAQFAENPFRAVLHLDLPPGKVFVRAGVLDVPSQKMGTIEIPQTVAKDQTLAKQ